MTEKRIYKLKTDTVFKQLITPLSAEELRQLEQNIIRDGCREPLCVWNSTILDGHNRYAICTRMQIPFMIQKICVRNREEAMAWICANQLGRRNITHETRKYLIGKRYEMEKIIGAHNAAGCNQHTIKAVRAKMLPEPPFGVTAGRTRERLGEEYNISHATVLKYEKYSQSLDLLSEVVPELVPKILSGEVKISHNNIVDLTRLSLQDAGFFSQKLSRIDEFSGYSEMRKLIPAKPGTAKKNNRSIPAGSVKDMPSYDPDAEISSLILTIPSWANSMDRVCSAANLSNISDNAHRKLKNELLKLKNNIDHMLSVLKEEI